MKKPTRAERLDPDRDTMRVEYNFSMGKRGITAARYAQGTNVVVIDPEVLDVFPESASINDALRALAPVIRQRRARRPPDKPMHQVGYAAWPGGIAIASATCARAAEVIGPARGPALVSSRAESRYPAPDRRGSLGPLVWINVVRPTEDVEDLAHREVDSCRQVAGRSEGD